MNSKDLHRLGLSPEEEKKIEVLCLPSLNSLLGMIKASPKIFEKFFGRRRSQALRISLEGILNEEGREFIENKKRINYGLGARLDTPPDTNTPGGFGPRSRFVRDRNPRSWE